MDHDEEILKAFQDAMKRGKKQLSSESIFLMTSIDRRTVYDKLNSMQRFGIIKPIEVKRKILYWELVD